MGYLTKAWQHRLYSFNWPIQIACKHWSLLSKQTWPDSLMTNLQANTYVSYFDIVFVQDTFVYIQYSGKVHASIHICAHTHTNTHSYMQGDTHTLPHTHTRSPINTFKHTLFNIMHMFHLHYNRDCHLITYVFPFSCYQHGKFQYLACSH